MVTTRSKTESRNYYDFNFGLQRKLPLNYFSVNADLLFGYQKSIYNNWNYFNIKDSIGIWQTSVDQYSVVNMNGAYSYNHYFSGGLIVGITFDHPLSKHLILTLNANYAAAIRFQFAHSEVNDIYNEFYSGNSILLDIYGTLGLGLRYVFGKKEKPAESGN